MKSKSDKQMFFKLKFNHPLWIWHVGPKSNSYELSTTNFFPSDSLEMKFNSPSGLSFEDEFKFSYGPFLKWTGQSSLVLIINEAIYHVFGGLNLPSHKIIGTTVSHPRREELRKYYTIQILDLFWSSISFKRSKFEITSILKQETIYSSTLGEFNSYEELESKIISIKQQEPIISMVPKELAFNQFSDIVVGFVSVVLFSQNAVNKIKNVIGDELNVSFESFNEYEIRFDDLT